MLPESLKKIQLILPPKIQSHSQGEPKEGTNQTHNPGRQKLRAVMQDATSKKAKAISVRERINSNGSGFEKDETMLNFIILSGPSTVDRDSEGADSAKGFHPFLDSASLFQDCFCGSWNLPEFPLGCLRE